MADDQLSFLIADLSRFTAGEVVALALDIQANLQEDTPRDTGWARANWVPSLSAPFEDLSIHAISDPSPAQIAMMVSRQQEGLGEVLGYRDVTQGAIFTTNNVPYIGRLNDGHSPQAGSAFIQMSVSRAMQQRETVSSS